MIIFGIILVVVFLLLFIPLKVNIEIKNSISIKVYLWWFIRVLNFKFNDDESKNKDNKTEKVQEKAKNKLVEKDIGFFKLAYIELKELLSKIRVKKLQFNLNINTKDYILNAYLVTMLNTIIPCFIQKHRKQFCLSSLTYQITSHENKINLDMKCIFFIVPADIMSKLIKFIVYKRKKRGNEKNGKGTSYRKSYGDSHVIFRNNG